MKKKNNILFGLILICLAAVILLNQFNVFGSVSVFGIVIAVLLVCAIISGIREHNFGGIFFPLALLYIVFDEQIEALTGFPETSTWIVLLVALLLSVGFSMIFPNWEKTSRWHEHRDENMHGNHQKTVDKNEDGKFFCENRFGEFTRRIETDNLMSASLRNNFGEMNIHFENATVYDQIVYVDVQVSFGSLKLYVPKEWDIEQNISVFAAQVKEENYASAAGTKAIRLSGTVNFGEIIIIYL